MNYIIEKLISTLLSLLPTDFLKKSLKNLLENLRKDILASDSKLDDALLIPLLDRIERELNL